MSDSGGRDLERQAWIALAATSGVGDVTFGRLLEVFGSAASALASVAGTPRREGQRGLAQQLDMRLSREVVANIRAMADDPGQPMRQMEQLGGWVLLPLDAAYPARLHELEYPPRVLFGLGRQEALTEARMVAVVGTRRPTAAGRDLAVRVAARLAEFGVTVVSGLAVGIDGAAHLACLESGGQTVAVVGSGLDEPGPANHRRLARAVAAQGAVVSELAFGVRPTRGTFPRRNRIISALASTTIVIEAPARSGALITARHALEQGRDLLVAPGRPMDARVAGCLALLRESPARPLVGLDEMIADLDLAQTGDGHARALPATLPITAALDLLGPHERAVATSLISGPQTVDALVRSSGLAPGVVAAALTLLQLRGWARVHGAMQLAAGPLLAGRGQSAA